MKKPIDPYMTDKTYKMSAKYAVSLAEHYFNNSGVIYYSNLSLVIMYNQEVCSYQPSDAGNCTGWDMRWLGVIIKNGSYYVQEYWLSIFYDKQNILKYDLDEMHSSKLDAQGIAENISDINNETPVYWKLDSYQIYKLAEKEVHPLDHKDTLFIYKTDMVLMKRRGSWTWDITWVYHCKSRSLNSDICVESKDISMNANSGEKINVP
jgi:hypothetical protein